MVVLVEQRQSYVCCYSADGWGDRVEAEPGFPDIEASGHVGGWTRRALVIRSDSGLYTR